MTKNQAIDRARRAKRAADRALDQFHRTLRQAADAGVTRRELGDAVDLSPSRVQQIVTETGEGT